MIKEVSLCSGIGGFSLGFEWAKFAEPITLIMSSPDPPLTKAFELPYFQ